MLDIFESTLPGPLLTWSPVKGAGEVEGEVDRLPGILKRGSSDYGESDSMSSPRNQVRQNLFGIRLFRVNADAECQWLTAAMWLDLYSTKY